MRYSCVLAALLCFCLFATTSSAAQRPDKVPPNIVIIFCDDLGYADIGAFGATGYQTPNLDRLAKDGCVFRNFHVAQAVCSASRAALHTGCYPNRIGIHGALNPHAKTGIHKNEMTLGEIAKQRGYATALFGKWHLGHRPEFLPPNHGYDEYFGLPYSNDMWPYHPEHAGAGVAKRKDGYPELPMIDGTNIVISKIEPRHQEQLTTWYTEHSVDFIRRNRERPFLLVLTHSMPHVPLYVSDKFRGKTARGLFGDVIAEIDWSVGEVSRALRDAGVEDRTWVIFTSDNGPWLNHGEHAGSARPLREGKGTSWEGGTRVPCVMRWPGKIPAGTESKQMLMTIDLLPTIANLIGARTPDHAIDGLDVWPIIAGEKTARNPHAAYWTYYASNELQSVTTGDGKWKLVLPHTYRTLSGRPGGKAGKPVAYDNVKIANPELYDLENDISEKTDVAAHHPEVVRELLKEAENARQELGDTLRDRVGKGAREPGKAVGG
jgi:arylsulfatase